MFVDEPGIQSAAQKVAHAQRRVVIVGANRLTLADARTLKEAFEANGAETHAFRADRHYNFSEVRPILHKATHVLLVLSGADEAIASAVLFDLDVRGDAAVGIVCLGDVEDLRFYRKRLAERQVQLIVVGTPQQQAQLWAKWRPSHSLVASHIGENAQAIARVFCPRSAASIA